MKVKVLSSDEFSGIFNLEIQITHLFECFIHEQWQI